MILFYLNSSFNVSTALNTLFIVSFAFASSTIFIIILSGKSIPITFYITFTGSFSNYSLISGLLETSREINFLYRVPIKKCLFFKVLRTLEREKWLVFVVSSPFKSNYRQCNSLNLIFELIPNFHCFCIHKIFLIIWYIKISFIGYIKYVHRSVYTLIKVFNIIFHVITI